MIWISDKWIWIHAREVEVSQDEQNGKKVKMLTLDLKNSNFKFDLNIKLPYCP